MSLYAKFPGRCPTCSQPIRKGDPIKRHGGPWGHAVCPPAADVPTPEMPQRIRDLVPSDYQAAARTLIAMGPDGPHVVMDAVAGSGKSTTIAWISWGERAALGTAHYCAFNSRIEREMRPLLPPWVSSSTLHSAGRQMLERARGKGRAHVDRDLCARLYETRWPTRDHRDADDNRAALGPVCTLVDLARGALSGVAPSALDALVERHNVDLGEADPSTVHARVGEMVDMLQVAWLDAGQLDFGGMIYLPTALGLKPARPYATVLIDETQDLNASQCELALRLGSRVFAVGDPFQSIYGWRGADTEAMPRLLARLASTPRGVEQAPLSICYRCPTSHLDLVRHLGLHPSIQPRDGAPVGTVDVLPQATWSDALTGQDPALILCRTNAPLMSYALRLISKAIPCRIEGRDIGSALASLVRRIRHRRDGDDLGAFIRRVGAWHARTSGRLLAAGQSTQQVDDQRACLEALCDSDQVETTEDLLAVLADLFRDGGDEKIVFSTVHKAKGLQSPWVVILESRLLPGPWARQDWEREEEAHIAYVALTRSQDRLSFVGLAQYGGRPIEPTGAPNGGPGPMPEPEPTPADKPTPTPADPTCRECQALPPVPGADLCAPCAAPKPPEDRPDLSALPTWGATGDGSYTGCALADWEEIRDAYRAAGLYAELRQPPRWRQLALVVGLGPDVDADLVRVSTTINAGAARSRAKGANAIDVARVATWDGPPLAGSRRKVLRTAGWRGRVADRVNGILRSV